MAQQATRHAYKKKRGEYPELIKIIWESQDERNFSLQGILDVLKDPGWQSNRAGYDE